MTDPDIQLRALADRDGTVHLVTRDLTFQALGQSSLDPAGAHPSALDLLVAALATDLVAGFVRAARRAGVRVHDCELRLSGRLANPLKALGVVGENGSPALVMVSGSLYVNGDATGPELQAPWAWTLEHSAVRATLARTVTIDIALKPFN